MKHNRWTNLTFLLFLILFVSFILAGCASTKAFIKNTERLRSVQRIAVLPFICGRPDFGYAIADSLSGYLMQSRFRIIERGQLNRILEEQGLTMSGVLNDSSLLIGRIKDIDAVIIGSATTSYGFAGLIPGGNVEYISDCSSHMVDIETGEVLIGVNFTTSSASTTKGVSRASKVGIWLGMQYSKY